MIVKVCGATTEQDVLSAAGADLVGLWYAVPGGRSELGLSRLADVAAAVRRDRHARPVLVTLESDPERVAEAVAASDVSWVQLHGYQPPGAVRALRRNTPWGTTIVKVLHVRGDRCQEQPLIEAYQRAGADAFLVDAVTGDGRVGSTASSLDPEVVLALAERVRLPFMVAGGLGPASRKHFRDVAAHPRFLGIDVDSAVRDEDGRIRRDRVRALLHAWRGDRYGGVRP
ncbi:phosphoribosylanthranilate isomerase [Nocardiopsis arvandica]|uniref:N-(5'-phosphoribosyl)anthranilate isomerase n=1 Tax=Nocardiopsis sinuspersici TaxID=501010 RepID=A0A7Y9XH34_9ACTN|nr:phosphoribosylanthranilate isomerase [Nocardiopsis sinuspersici]